jgi:ribA/ribD-fused uncharacterized protein
MTETERKKWSKSTLDVMYKLLRAKFRPETQLADMLLATGDSLLIEATTDQFWGAGMRYEVLMRASSSCFPGDNKLGLLLMQVRRELARI